MLPLDTPAPAFSAPDQSGTTRSLADAAGKWLVLYFYPKDEACGFRDRMGDLQKQGVMLYGVSADSVESHAAFAKKHHLNFPLLADPDKKIRMAYQAEKRCTYVIDPKGMIANTYIVQDAEEHAGELMDDLAEMMKA